MSSASCVFMPPNYHSFENSLPIRKRETFFVEFEKKKIALLFIGLMYLFQYDQPLECVFAAVIESLYGHLFQLLLFRRSWSLV